MTPDTLSCSETMRDVNGLSLQMAVAGEAGRPLVILLHGFPDLWQGWHFQIPMLEAAGFRVIAPNQRGYGTQLRMNCAIGRRVIATGIGKAQLSAPLVCLGP